MLSGIGQISLINHVSRLFIAYSDSDSSSSDESDSDADAKDAAVPADSGTPVGNSGDAPKTASKSVPAKLGEQQVADKKVDDSSASSPSPGDSSKTSHGALGPDKRKAIIEVSASEKPPSPQNAESSPSREADRVVQLDDVLVKTELDADGATNTGEEHTKEIPVSVFTESKGNESVAAVLDLPEPKKEANCGVDELTKSGSPCGVSTERSSVAKEPVLITCDDYTSATEMPQLTKSTDDEVVEGKLEEKQQTSRGKKRSAAEPAEKVEKKGKPEGKKKAKEHVGTKEVEEVCEPPNETERDTQVEIKEEFGKEDNPLELNFVTDKVEAVQDVSVSSDEKFQHDEKESGLSEEDTADWKSSKAKKSKQITDSSVGSDKRAKATVGKGDEKKEGKGKKKGKNIVGDGRLFETQSQDSVASEQECSQEDKSVSKDNDRLTTDQVESCSVTADLDSRVSASGTGAFASLEKTTDVKALDSASLVAVAHCNNSKSDLTATDCKSESWTTGAAAEREGQELREETSRPECYRNVFEEAKSMQGCHRQGGAVEDTISLLRSSCPQAVSAFTDSPPDTSSDEFGASASGGSASPQGPAVDADEEHTSTKSELEANMEVAAYMGAVSNDGELSSDDNDDDDDDSAGMNPASLSPVNVPSLLGHVSKGGSGSKRKMDEGHDEAYASGKRRKKEKPAHQHHHRTRSNHNRLMALGKASGYKHQGMHLWCLFDKKNYLNVTLNNLQHNCLLLLCNIPLSRSKEIWLLKIVVLWL